MKNVNTSEPELIYTSRGNVLASSLTMSPLWQFDTDPATGLIQEIRFIEEYRSADGEIVKRSVHTYKNGGGSAAADQGVI